MSMDDVRGGLCLSICDVTKCEGRCCYDGVYLQKGEEDFLRELVGKVPALRAGLPEEFIVDGYFNGESLGRKTATRPHEYRSAEFPLHFTRTRCVFADSQGFCELEKFGRSNGQHPWTYKPTTCWMFPLQEDDGVMAEPVSGPQDDPYFSEAYPGYASCIPCGRHDPAGKPWHESLSREIGYLEGAANLPMLGTPGHTVDELLAAIPRTKKNPA
ncbi:MAG: hypothetical protein ABI645_10480 [Pseudomonadota bacterium]